ncbi:MAG: ACT domain-containing protein [Christensenellaceae bacterium]|jgi:hypothetical protein
MLIKQISVFLENRAGRLTELTKVLATHNIDIIAISIADTADFGILRCIVDDPAKAEEVLRANGFTASTTRVIAVELDDRPGGLSAVLEYLSEEGISIEYVYSFVRSKSDKALILFKVNDPDEALAILGKHNVNTLCLADIVGK